MVEGFDPAALADELINGREITTVDTANSQTEVLPVAVEEEVKSTETQSSNVTDEKPANQETEKTNTDWLTNASKIAGVEIKTEDELKSLIEKARNAQNLESEYGSIKQEFEALKSSQPQFANDRIKKLNELYQSGASEDQIEAFNKIQSVGEIKDLKPIEAVKLALQLRDGLTPEEAERKINKTYQLDDNIYDSDAIAGSEIDLKIDSKKEYEYLQGFKAKASEVPTPPVDNTEAEMERSIAEYRQKITPIAQSIQSEFTAIKGVNLNGKTGDEALNLDIPVSEDSKNQIAKLVSDYATVNDIPMDEKGVAHLKEFAKRTLILNNFESIAIHINSKAEERIRAEVHNPASINRGQDAPRTSAADAMAAEIYNHVMNN